MADTNRAQHVTKRLNLPKFFGTKTQQSHELDELITLVHAHHPKIDTTLIEHAYEVAEKAHRGQFRKSGAPYITHPLAVATILADLGADPTTLAGALLHDTVEDTDYSLEQLTQDFGTEIAMLVDGVTKLDRVKYGDSAQAETVRKMVVAMSKDIRVLVIKLADRLHNARTWKYVPHEKAAKKAQETLEIYAPLAHRLGISTIKLELEDLSFAVLYPKVYDEIVRLVRARTPQREEYVKDVISIVSGDMTKQRINAEIKGRPKQYYSVYQKMVVRGREFDDIYDLVGIRIIVDSIRDCYAALGAIHARWSPIPGRFKDYIAIPKFNLYQSLHTTVIGPGGKPIEIQIRTHEMDQRAEYGVAAHWKYKENMKTGAQGDTGMADDTQLAWVKHLTDWQSDTSDPREFIDSLRFEIGAKEVYVFTPKGKVVGLPAGATPVDFAYAVHTEVGHRTMGAKVNGRLVPLETQLVGGDNVEIFTSKSPDAGPSKDWLNFVKSPRARAKIKQWFTKERRSEAGEQGKEALIRALRKQNLPLQSLLNSEQLMDVASELNYTTVDTLCIAIGEGHVSTQSVIEKLVARVGEHDDTESSNEVPVYESSRTRRPSTNDVGVIVRGASDVLVKLAKCCTPVPGDEIVGFVTRGNGVSVHRSDCRNIESMKDQSERFVDVEWAPNSSSLFLVQIQVEALDRGGLLSDVTRVLTEHHVNILSATVHTSDDRLAISRFVFEMGDTVHLDRLLNAVRRIDAVYDVYRVSDS